jgi:hypothetical protein
MAFCSFAVFGLFSSIGSLIVRGDLHITSPFVWGVAAFVVFGVSAVVQTALAALPTIRMLAIGLGATPIGMAVVIFALYHPSLAWYLLGSAVVSIRIAMIVFSVAIIGVSAFAGSLQSTALKSATGSPGRTDTPRVALRSSGRQIADI